MDTVAPATFDALIKFRAPSTLKARLDRIAAKRSKHPAEVYREAAQEKVEREERRMKRELATK